MDWPSIFVVYSCSLFLIEFPPNVVNGRRTLLRGTRGTSNVQWRNGEKESIVKTFKLIISKTGSPGTSAYLGCFSVNENWSSERIANANISGELVNVKTCIEKCWLFRRRLALLKSGSKCACSDILHGVDAVQDSHCDKPCQSIRSQACGGISSFSDYFTGYMEEPLFTQIKLEEIPKSFEGCFEDPAYSALCPYHVTTPRLHVAMCMSLCEDQMFIFAALDSPEKCCCANTVTGAYMVKPSMCPLRCSQGSELSCGGDEGYIAVYATGVTEVVKKSRVMPAHKPSYLWMRPDIDETNIQTLQ